MCGTCGCGDDSVSIRKPGETLEHHHTHDHHHGDTEHTHDHTHSDNHKSEHEHSHDHSNHGHNHHNHSHDHRQNNEIELEVNILHKNDLLAERNRGFFEAKNIRALNLVSSPGSGKTSLLERTIKEMGKELPFYVIEGDQQTMNDANRIEAAGAPVVQVNTGNGCHLDADMINKAVKKLEVKENSLLIIENVGNLVCPSMFDLGESKRIVIISTTEGEDKPIKYPNMFASSDICVINKTDLLPYLDFDVEKTKEYALKVNHHLEFFELSVKSGEGMDAWYQWLREQMKK